MNGRIFKTENATEGENYPPMHPRCRSTTVPYEYGDILNNKTSKQEVKEIEDMYNDLIKKEPKITE